MLRRAARERVDCVVIGAGVVGLASAMELATRGREVLVLDSAPTFGTATSSRNSQVIHAGIYHPPHSLKSRFCSRGRDLLYKYCADRSVPHKRIGKLIVATSSAEIPKLNEIFSYGTRNGVPGLRMMERSEAVSLEPQLHCLKAIHSPLTGILDTHSFMLSLVAEAEDKGATFSYNTTVIGGHVEENRVCLHISETKGDAEFVSEPELILVPNLVINSAGLSASILAKRFRGLREDLIPSTRYARGCYFTLSNTRVPPFERLIYPIPVEGGIGVHVTLDLAGQLKFGPDVEWLDDVDEMSTLLNKFDYSVDPNRAELFYGDIRKYYPNLKDESLEAGYAGIRPKLSGRGEPAVDFLVQGQESHGIAGLVNLFGIESPGLTSSLAIAEHIATTYLS